jgi:hypothetical protein
MTFMFKIHFNSLNPRANYSQCNKIKIRSIDSNPLYQRANLSQSNHKTIRSTYMLYFKRSVFKII